MQVSLRGRQVDLADANRASVVLSRLQMIKRGRPWTVDKHRRVLHTPHTLFAYIDRRADRLLIVIHLTAPHGLNWLALGKSWVSHTDHKGEVSLRFTDTEPRP